MKIKMKVSTILLFCMGAAMIFSGCGKKNVIEEEPICGGTVVHNDDSAPKTIESDDLIFFETDFFRWPDYTYDVRRGYHFKMVTGEDGGIVISEGYDEKLKCDTDADFAAKLQKIIRDNNLISLNGINKYTNGLPPEFGPVSIKAEYGSGEKLNVYMDGNPESEWSFEVLDLFAKELGAHGVEDLLPSKEDSVMTRFELEYTDGDMRYLYGELLVPSTEAEVKRSLEDIATNGFDEENYVKKVWAEPWDRTGATKQEERRADITEEYYDSLQKIVEETDLRSFYNGRIFPGDFDYEGTTCYYSFYIEYESGKVLNGFSDDPEEYERFKPIADKFADYFDEYLAQNE